MLSIQLKGLKEAQADLKKMRRAVPYAEREYVNSAAFAGRKVWISRAQADMVLRTKWTTRSLQVIKATASGSPHARLGSVADYMRVQEEGATEQAQGKHGVPIPGAAPGKRKARKGKVSARNRLGALTLKVSDVRGSRKRRNAAAISMAARAGGGVVYLDLGRARGLYRITGTKRGIRVRKVWDLSKKSITIPRNPMLAETLRLLSPQLPQLAEAALLAQFKRNKLFGY